MHSVGGLRPNPASRPVDHAVGDLLAPVGGQAVQEQRLRSGRLHERLVHPEGLEVPQPSVRLFLLAHGRPYIGVDDVHAGYRVGGPVSLGEGDPGGCQPVPIHLR